jgi:hypothetical protein
VSTTTAFRVPARTRRADHVADARFASRGFQALTRSLDAVDFWNDSGDDAPANRYFDGLACPGAGEVPRKIAPQFGNADLGHGSEGKLYGQSVQKGMLVVKLPSGQNMSIARAVQCAPAKR